MEVETSVIREWVEEVGRKVEMIRQRFGKFQVKEREKEREREREREKPLPPPPYTITKRNYSIKKIVVIDFS